MNNLRLRIYSSELTMKAVDRQDPPFKLRSGELSSWYVDHRQGLASGRMLRIAGGFIVDYANRHGIDFDVVAGLGVGGRPLATAVGMKSPVERGIALGNDDKSDTDLLNGYGLHGQDVKGKMVLAVDDIASTGDSLITLINMIRGDGGEVTDAITFSERSNGRAATALAELGVRHHYLLAFIEADGLLRPAV